MEMGGVEAMQHLESSRVIASPNGSDFENILGQLPMENGEWSFLTMSPKLERQRITAVRDFPPGCGRFAQINYLKSVNEAAFLGTYESVPTESLASWGKNGDEISDLPKNLHELNNLRRVEEAASVGAAEGLINKDSPGDGQTVENLTLSTGYVDETDLIKGKAVGTVEITESVTTLEHEIPDFQMNVHQLNGLRSVGIDGHLISKGKNGDGQGIEKMMVSTGQVDGTVLINGKAVGLASLKEEMAAVLSDRNICSPPDGSISVSNGNSLGKTAIDKYPSRRIVSVIRDFPPLCGRNAPLVARNFGQERSVMGDEPSSLLKTQKTLKQTGEDVQEQELHKSELGGNVTEVIGDKVQPKGQGHAVQGIDTQDECDVYSKMMAVWEDRRKVCAEKSSREKFLDTSYYPNQLHEEDFESSELPSNRVTVLGLMAGSNCPFKKAKRVYKHVPGGGTSERKRIKLHFRR